MSAEPSITEEAFPVIVTGSLAAALSFSAAEIRYRYPWQYLWLSWLPVAFVILTFWMMYPLHRSIPTFEFPQFGYSLLVAATIIEVAQHLKIHRAISGTVATIACALLLYRYHGWS